MSITERRVTQRIDRQATTYVCDACGAEAVLSEANERSLKIAPGNSLHIPWNWVFVTIERFYDQQRDDPRRGEHHFCSYACLSQWLADAEPQGEEGG